MAVNETGRCRVHRVWLSGPKSGSSELFIDGLWGYPDNLSTDDDGLIWIALPSRKRR